MTVTFDMTLHYIMGNTLAFILDPGPWKDWTLNRAQTQGTRRPGMHINNDYRHLSPGV